MLIVLGLRSLLVLAVLLASAAAAGAQPAPAADWLRTTRATVLWSGPSEPAEQFSLVPADTPVLPRGERAASRALVFYPGDGAARQPGAAWIDVADLAPGAPPDWLSSSELDGAHPFPHPDAPRRVAHTAPPAVSARQVAVVDDASGLLLYGHAPHTRAAPASTTKIVTALVALQRAPDLDETVPVSVDGWAMALADGSSVMGLVPGTRLSMRTLLFGLLLSSGNDVAEQLARTLGESRAEFVAAMNEEVDRLGLLNTRFANPSGMDEVGHFSSAYDLAQLGRAAMRDETFRDIVATPVLRADGFVLRGRNPLLGEYPGADGIKTGTSDAAGRALVASAVQDGQRVHVVVLHSTDLFGDASALLDWVWSTFEW